LTTPDVFIEQFVDEGLGNSAHLVGSHAAGTAVLIDPLRDVDRYRYAAEQHSVRITHVLDTHLHNDFISGARELAAQAGAVVAASAAARLGFEHRPLVEGDTLPLGGAEVRVLATPGHTPEHLSFLLAPATGEAGPPTALFSGGALMVGGAARTDLLGHDVCVPLARQLYHTLQHKLLALPDDVAVYPTHGAGSFCAAPASPQRTTTIGQERRGNRLALARGEDAFVSLALSGLPSYPVYYKEIRPINQRGPRVLGGVPLLQPLGPHEFRAWMERGALVLDVRPRRVYARGHLPGAYAIELDAPLVVWAGWTIPFGAPLLLVAADAPARESAVRQLIRIGFDDLPGYLAGGLEAWTGAGLPVATVPTLTAAELHTRLEAGEPLTVLDVRQDAEWDAGHIPGAVHIENGRLAWDRLPFAPDQPVAIHCASGTRAMTGASVLARRGFTNVSQVEGGFRAWERAGFSVERM
jgi:hydroxyacylglutathione hydrolase